MTGPGGVLVGTGRRRSRTPIARSWPAGPGPISTARRLGNPLAADGLFTWRVCVNGGLHVVRHSLDDDAFRRELYARKVLGRELPLTNRLVLCAVDPRLRALIMHLPLGHEPGRTCCDAPDTHMHLGAVLKIWHGYQPLAHRSLVAQHSMEFARRYANGVDGAVAQLPRQRNQLFDPDVIRGYANQLLKAASALRPVFGHGTFGSGCIWFASGHNAVVTACGQAQPMPAVMDLARLLVLMSPGDTSARAFTAGHGRPLDDLERRMLVPVSVLARFHDYLHAARTSAQQDDQKRTRLLLRTAIRQAFNVGGAI